MRRATDFIDSNLLALQISSSLVGRTLLYKHLDAADMNSIDNLNVYAVFNRLEKLEIRIRELARTNVWL